MAQISFSIVVVCLNPGEKLLKTVQSVLNQKYGNYEIVVKDGGSTDGSLEQLPADSRIRVYTRPDSGIYDAMNQAMSYVTGQFVQFLNCGDLLHERYGAGTACSCDWSASAAGEPTGKAWDIRKKSGFFMEINIMRRGAA